MILRKLWIAFITIRNYDRIPKLPRGMLATNYEKIARPERGVLARLGARDPIGVKVAMRRHGVETIEELTAILEHQQPRRRVGERLWLALGRIIGGKPYDPNAREIRALARHKIDPRQAAIEQRIKSTINAMKE
jgi:hypothetical protein